MTISAAQVRELRERTGIGIMECKRVLEEAGGDITGAIHILRTAGCMTAAQKASRTTAEGRVQARIGDGVAILVEVNCETDFVARDQEFVDFVERFAAVALETRETCVEALLEGELESQRLQLVQTTGENISVRRLSVLEGGCIGAYVHGEGSLGALVALASENTALAEDLAMHIVAMRPAVVAREQVPQADINRERELFLERAEQSGKPPEIIEKMVTGRLDKYLSEVSLLEQPYVQDTDRVVAELLGENRVAGFVCYAVGEGIERETADFASEVADMVGSVS